MLICLDHRVQALYLGTFLISGNTKETGKTVTEYITEQRLEYGPIFLVTYFNRPVVILGDPSFVREVFVNHSKYLCKPSFLYENWGLFLVRGPLAMV